MVDISLNYNWPSCFPVDVPGDDVIPAQGSVYRLVDCFPPTPNDFLIYREEHPGYEYSEENVRFSYGISLWNREKKVRQAKTNYPADNQLGLKKIALGNITSNLGVIYTRKDGHITLWPQLQSEPHLCGWKEICDD